MNRSNRQIRKFGILGAASIALLLGTFSPDAFAQDPEGGVRYNRKSGKAKAKGDLLNTKFKDAVAEEEKKKGRRVITMEGADFAKRRKAVEQEMADKQIQFLVRLIKSTDKADPEYPDLLFRLADHHLEKKAFFDNSAGAMFEKIYAAEDAGKNKEAKQLEIKQKGFYDKGKKASEQAANVYKALVTDPKFQNYKRMDEALYYYAFELGQLGREQEMQDAYRRLINNYPNSSFISQAYLAFADYYYNKSEIQNAVRLYEKVLTFKDSPVYAYALYKLAWCHLNPIGTAEARYDLSLNYFIQTIKATEEGRAGSEAAGKQLRKDARRDLVRAYVHAAKPAKAQGFFDKWGKGPGKDEDDSRRMMEGLANQYFGNGMYTESTFIYKQLQKQYEGDESECDWQARIVVNTLATDNKEVQWNETKRLGEYWTQYKDAEHTKAVKKKCRDDALDTMKQMATVWHDEAEKTKLDRTYELAELAYGGFLEVFPKDKDAYELQYYYGELLWALATNNYALKDKDSKAKGIEYFLKAHDQFVRTLELDPKGKYTQDSAFAQMLAMKNALEYDETGGKSKACKTNSEGVCIYKEKKKKRKKRTKDTKLDAAEEYPETDYTESESKMLNAYDIYTKYVKNKDDKELPKIMYHRAKLAMIHNRFDDARPLLEELVVKFDGSVYAAWSSEMLLDLLTIKWVDKNATPEETVKASDDLEEWCKKFMELKIWKHPEADQVRDAVPRLLAGIGWKKGMAYREAGVLYVEGKEGGDPEGFSKCAEQFVKVFNDFEDHDRADTLLWNAAECSTAAYQVGQAIRLRKVLLDNFPDSQHARDSLFYLGGAYQAVAYYPDAAQRYEEFAEKYPKDKEAANALQNAYLFRLGLGEEEKAEANLVKYESVYKRKDPQKAAGIFWSRYALLDSEAKKKRLAEDYLKVYGARGGVDRQAVAEAVIGQYLWRASCDEELLYDSCLSIKRKRALSASEQIEKRKRLERRLARQKKKKGGEEEEDDSKKYKPPARCGSATQGVITIHRRSKKKRDAAQARFNKVVKLAKKNPKIPTDDTQRVEAFKNAWAMALVYRADKKYEDYLRLRMPEELSFHVEEWRKDSGIPSWERKYKEQVKAKEDSTKRLGDYFETKMKLGGELQKEYAQVKNTGSPYWTLAAAARTAMVNQNFADELYRADVPRDTIKTEEMFFAYCDALSDQAQPVQAAALSAFEYCIQRSTEFQFFNDFSRLCEEEMQQRDADKYPATNEVFGESIYTASRISKVEVLTNPEGEKLNQVKRKKKNEGVTESDKAVKEIEEEEE